MKVDENKRGAKCISGAVFFASDHPLKFISISHLEIQENSWPLAVSSLVFGSNVTNVTDRQTRSIERPFRCYCSDNC